MVRVIGPADWALLRDLRLQALKDSPEAFASTYDREDAWLREAWLTRIVNYLWVVAEWDGEAEAVGVARSVRDPRHPRDRYLESMWVKPGFRRQGVARRLVWGLVGHEVRAGACCFLLWVFEGNDGARAAYERMGFVATGHRQVFPGSSRVEERMRLCVDNLGLIP